MSKLHDARGRGIYAAAMRAAETAYETAFPVENAFVDDEFVKEFDALWERLMAATPKAASEGAMACDHLVRKFETGAKRVLEQARKRSAAADSSRPSSPPPSATSSG